MDHVADQNDHANEQAEHPEREQHATNASVLKTLRGNVTSCGPPIQRACSLRR